MRPPVTAHRQLVAPVALLALLLCVFSLIELWRLGEESPAIDFYRAWAMAQSPSRYLPPGEDPYAEASQDRLAESMRRRLELAGRPPRLAAAVEASDRLRLTATPFLYSVFGLISNRTYERDVRLYRLGCLASTVFAVGLLGRLWSYSPVAVLLWLALLGQFFQPLRSDLRVGNVNQLQLAQLAVCLALSAWAERRQDQGAGQRPTDLLRLAAGMTLAFAVAFKPNTMFILPLILLLRWGSGRGRELSFLLAGLGAGGVAAWTVGCLYFGSWSIWQHWLQAVRVASEAPLAVRYGNIAPARLIADHTDLEAGPLLAVVCALPIVAVLGLKRRRLGASRNGDAYAVGLGLLFFLLVTPLAWQHYLLLSVPLFLLLWRPGGSTKGPRMLALPAFALLAIEPVAKLFSMTDPVRQAPLVHLGLLLLLGASLWGAAVEAATPRSPSP